MFNSYNNSDHHHYQNTRLGPPAAASTTTTSRKRGGQNPFDNNPGPNIKRSRHNNSKGSSNFNLNNNYDHESNQVEHIDNLNVDLNLELQQRWGANDLQDADAEFEDNLKDHCEKQKEQLNMIKNYNPNNWDQSESDNYNKENTTNRNSDSLAFSNPFLESSNPNDLEELTEEEDLEQDLDLKNQPFNTLQLAKSMESKLSKEQKQNNIKEKFEQIDSFIRNRQRHTEGGPDPSRALMRGLMPPPQGSTEKLYNNKNDQYLSNSIALENPGLRVYDGGFTSSSTTNSSSSSSNEVIDLTRERTSTSNNSNFNQIHNDPTNCNIPRKISASPMIDLTLKESQLLGGPTNTIGRIVTDSSLVSSSNLNTNLNTNSISNSISKDNLHNPFLKSGGLVPNNMNSISKNNILPITNLNHNHNDSSNSSLDGTQYNLNASVIPEDDDPTLMPIIQLLDRVRSSGYCVGFVHQFHKRFAWIRVPKQVRDRLTERVGEAAVEASKILMMGGADQGEEGKGEEEYLIENINGQSCGVSSVSTDNTVGLKRAVAMRGSLEAFKNAFMTHTMADRDARESEWEQTQSRGANGQWGSSNAWGQQVPPKKYDWNKPNFDGKGCASGDYRMQAGVQTLYPPQDYKKIGTTGIVSRTVATVEKPATPKANANASNSTGTNNNFHGDGHHNNNIQQSMNSNNNFQQQQQYQQVNNNQFQHTDDVIPLPSNQSEAERAADKLLERLLNPSSDKQFSNSIMSNLTSSFTDMDEVTKLKAIRTFLQAEDDKHLQQVSAKDVFLLTTELCRGLRRFSPYADFCGGDKFLARNDHCFLDINTIDKDSMDVFLRRNEKKLGVVFKMAISGRKDLQVKKEMAAELSFFNMKFVPIPEADIKLVQKRGTHAWNPETNQYEQLVTEKLYAVRDEFLEAILDGKACEINSMDTENKGAFERGTGGAPPLLVNGEEMKIGKDGKLVRVRDEEQEQRLKEKLDNLNSSDSGTNGQNKQSKILSSTAAIDPHHEHEGKLETWIVKNQGGFGFMRAPELYMKLGCDVHCNFVDIGESLKQFCIKVAEAGDLFVRSGEALGLAVDGYSAMQEDGGCWEDSDDDDGLKETKTMLMECEDQKRKRKAAKEIRKTMLMECEDLLHCFADTFNHRTVMSTGASESGSHQPYDLLQNSRHRKSIPSRMGGSIRTLRWPLAAGRFLEQYMGHIKVRFRCVQDTKQFKPSGKNVILVGIDTSGYAEANSNHVSSNHASNLHNNHSELSSGLSCDNKSNNNKFNNNINSKDHYDLITPQVVEKKLPAERWAGAKKNLEKMTAKMKAKQQKELGAGLVLSEYEQGLENERIKEMFNPLNKGGKGKYIKNGTEESDLTSDINLNVNSSSSNGTYRESGVILNSKNIIKSPPKTTDDLLAAIWEKADSERQQKKMENLKRPIWKIGSAEYMDNPDNFQGQSSSSEVTDFQGTTSSSTSTTVTTGSENESTNYSHNPSGGGGGGGIRSNPNYDPTRTTGPPGPPNFVVTVDPTLQEQQKNMMEMANQMMMMQQQMNMMTNMMNSNQGGGGG